MATPFDNNPVFRKWTYRIQWIVNGILAVAGAYLVSQHGDNLADYPGWYAVAVAVGPVLWSYLGVQADTNTPASPGEGGYTRFGTGGSLLNTLGVLLVAVSVLLLIFTLLKVFVVAIPVLVVVFIIGLVLVLLF